MALTWIQLPSTRSRASIARRLRQVAAKMTTAAITAVDSRYEWFGRLSPEHRASVTLVARSGVDGFIDWFGEGGSERQVQIFDRAPRELSRQVSLKQTVDLTRSIIDTVDAQIDELMPRADRPYLHAALNEYSRDVAFAAAEVYAAAAEVRGAWDVRQEATVVDAVMRGEVDDAVMSRVATLGWRSTVGALVMVGAAPGTEAETKIEDTRRMARTRGLDCLAAVHSDRLVVVLGGPALTADGDPLSVVGPLAERFGDGPVVVGPRVDRLAEAGGSARAALSGLRGAPGWPAAPRPVHADDLLPERALSGDGHARRALARDVYGPLVESGGGLLETLTCFLDEGLSIEASARALFVHANTVRYRLKRIHEVTGYSPTDPRDSYTLRLALTLGRLLGDHGA
ncbi:PucR family transcriptional regulator [Raineyella sp. LH-20]|uniref:PucR family transcriptional regulator n=1 Tax=Raineyella sp. LH-20 TaxID=3081204 RepID=UPI0029550A9B|nr:helix-turn-helix domain-containing protein [Raineyella sp. LH-20]WOP17846.1 helix-turn-helix domain-containing protein [Raineyella sp. LH-20]